MKRNQMWTLLLMMLTMSANVFAKSEGSVEATGNVSGRSQKKLGAYLGILGDPHPTLAGINVAYNISEMIRASIGYGKVSVSSGTLSSSDDGFSVSSQEESMTTLGAAAKFLVPGWSLTPSLTLGYSHIAISDGFITDEYKSNNFYFGLGGDWQAESGLNLGAGLNVSMNGAAPSAPYMNVGYFF